MSTPPAEPTPVTLPPPTDAAPVPDPAVAQHPAVVRVAETLEALGASGTVVVLDGQARTAAQAAAQLGVEVGAIANSLVFAVPEKGGPRAVLVLTSGAHRVNTERLADRLGLERLDRADPDLVRESTGFVIGGVAPVGHTTPLDTYVDVTLAQFERIWAAAGHPRSVFPTHYDELLRITAGHPVEVT